MFTDFTEKIKLTSGEKAWIRRNLSSWQQEPDGEEWQENMCLNAHWSNGIVFVAYRGQHRLCVCVNDWRGLSDRALIDAVSC